MGAEPVSRLTRWPGSERVLGPWAGKVLILDSVNWVGFWRSRSVLLSVLTPDDGLVPELPGPWKRRWG